MAWLYSLCEQVCETSDEMFYSLSSLEQWMEKQTQVSSSLRTFSEDYLLKSFKPRMDKLGQCYFQNLYGGELGSNSISEQENAALKSDPMGPKPTASIDSSARTTTNHVSRRLKKLSRHANQNLTQTEVSAAVHISGKKPNRNEKEFENSDETYLCQALVDFAIKDLRSQHKSSSCYKYYVIDDETFYVRRWTWSPIETNTIASYADIPRFDRTRVVKIINSKSFSESGYVRNPTSESLILNATSESHVPNFCIF